MKSQQKSQGAGDWEHQRDSRDEADPQRISGGDYGSGGRPTAITYGRSAPDAYPDSHYQYQAQRDHPGVEYFGGTGGYGGGRGEYGGAASPAPGSQGANRDEYGNWSRPGQEGRGGYRQQEAFQAGGRQPGHEAAREERSYSGSYFGRGGASRDENRFERGQQRENQEYQRQEYQRTHPEPFEVHGQRHQPPGWSEQGRPAAGYGQAQGYRGFQPGQPQDYHAQQGGVFGGFGSHADYQQPTGGYGSYGSYEVGSLPTPAERRQPRGPKNYVRSDDRIREELCERLAHHPGIDVSEVSVQVQEGRVSLEGTVPQRRMKYEIEDVADDCWGVKDVENRIRVQVFADPAMSPGHQGLGPSRSLAEGHSQPQGQTGEQSPGSVRAEARPPMTQMTPTGTSTGPGIALGGSAAPAGQPAGATEARTGGSKE